MKLAINRDELLRMLSDVSKVVEARNTVNVLNNLLVQSTGTEFSVCGTDMDIRATQKVELEGEPGIACVPAKTFLDVVRRAGTDEIKIEKVDNNLIVKSGRSRFKLPSTNEDIFPDFESSEFTAEFEIDLGDIISSTSFAMSNEEARYYFNGINLVAKDGNLQAVATTGSILALANIEADFEFDSIIIPKKLVGITPKGVVQVSVNDRLVEIRQGSLTLLSKLIDGIFPNVENAIPRHNDKLLQVPKSQMLKAIQRVATVCDPMKKCVSFEVTPGSLNLNVDYNQNGGSEDSLQTEYSGEPVTVHLNPDFVASGLSSLQDGDIEIEIGKPSDTVLFRNKENTDRFFLVSPMRGAR